MRAFSIGTKAGALTLAVLTFGATMAATASAEAQWRGAGWRAGGYHGGYVYRGNRGWNRGAGVAAGVIGGLAAGALIAGATRPAYGYYAPAPAYRYGGGYAPAYYAPDYYAPVYDAPVCTVRRQRVWIGPDTYQVRRVRVCR